jgi:hypothetical protein
VARPDCLCLFDKATDIPVYPLLAVGSEVTIHSRLSVIDSHIASGIPKNVIEDGGEVHDVSHKASNIPRANTWVRLEWINYFPGSLTCLYTHDKSNTRAHHYRTVIFLGILPKSNTLTSEACR